MHWYRWHPSTRALASRAKEFGPAAVIGLRSMRELGPLRAEYGFSRVRKLPALRAAEVRLTSGRLRALLAKAVLDARIRYVEPIGPSRQLLRLRNDPMLQAINPKINAPYEWEFAASRIDSALNVSRGSPTFVVGIIDSGVGDVPDLNGKLSGRWYFTDQADGGDDERGHGTAVASLIAAVNDDGFGMAGFGGATRVVSLRLDSFDDLSLAIAVAKLTSLGVRVINLSIGGRARDAPELQDALAKAELRGVLIVASAGNDSANSVSYPASDLQPEGGGKSYGLAVGATDFDDTRASFSNRGTHLSLVAPGNYLGSCYGLLAALPPSAKMFDGSCFPTFPGVAGARYGYVAGTSFSAAEVSGAAALVWAAAPNLRNFQVADILKRSARHDASGGWSPTVGWGVLDVAAAIEQATRRSSADALSISALGFGPGDGPGPGVTATGRALWSDGIAPERATVSCSASVKAAPLQTVEEAFEHGILTCTWDTTGIVGEQAMSGVVTLTEPSTGVTASKSFTTVLGDATPPTARALRVAGRSGSQFSLPFMGSEDTGEVAARIVVKLKKRVVAQLQGEFFSIQPGTSYSLVWQAPKRKAPSGYTFCVMLFDRGGNHSPSSCAPISLIG